ncbi:MAG TPA: primosomal protein N' [Actinomycetota bacterium]|nr:primosomal protein N' [Actinomycetota bacterium]
MLPLVPAWRVDKTFDYVVPEKLRPTVSRGALVRIPFGGRVVRGFVLHVSESSVVDELDAIKGVVIAEPLARPAMEQLLTDVARRYVVPRGRAFQRLVPPRVRARPGDIASPKSLPPPRRLPTYRGGSELLDAIERRDAGAWCIQLLPTEDRAVLIAEMIGATRSGSAIVCVPEVHYGSRVLEGVAALAPHLVRVDSATDPGERSSAWLRMAAGHALAGGGRAAVFTPSPDLGLVVVDEEHHQTYKEDRAPRYDARWVAERRAEIQGAVCVFMSASPSVETGSRAASGRFGSVSPARDARRAARPVVELVDRPDDRAISHELHERIAATLRAGDRVALLTPSPAFARAVWCTGCRRSLRCPRCEAGLFFDQSLRRVRCARCRLQEAAPDACPACGESAFRYVGAGSERLAEQVAKAFPRAAVARVDPARPAQTGAMPDVYVTTWIGTKPELRPDVSLVGVLDADWLIRRPDFRSAESAFQAMVEMAEWAGPAAAGGRLVIQTAEPGHHSLQAVVRGDYDFFLRRELEARRELSYPPSVELVKVTVAAADDGTARDIGDRLGGAGARVLGPIDTTTPQGLSARQFLIKTMDASGVADRARVILETAPKGLRLSVDVDPR